MNLAASSDRFVLSKQSKRSQEFDHIASLDTTVQSRQDPARKQTIQRSIAGRTHQALAPNSAVIDHKRYSPVYPCKTSELILLYITRTDRQPLSRLSVTGGAMYLELLPLSVGEACQGVGCRRGCTCIRTVQRQIASRLDPHVYSYSTCCTTCPDLVLLSRPRAILL